VASTPSIELAGIDDARVRWVAHADLVAAVSDVPREEFDEEPLNAGLTDMQWLAPRALAHQDVNQQLFEATEALIPLSFGTVFRDDSRVEAMLRIRATGLRERLGRVRGCSEWVVAVHRTAEPDASGIESVRELQQEIAAAQPGRAHLLRKRLETVEREAQRQVEVETAEHVLTSLRGIAEDVFQEPLPTDAVDKPLLRASVLVKRADEARFVQEVEQLQTGWYQVLLTGPWPPYRFGGLEYARTAQR
jgi:hypothetical protein